MSAHLAGCAPQRLAAIVRNYGRKVFVLGDIIADEYLYGRTTRVSREAPVLILRKEGRRFFPGGAGNTAYNLAALGAQVSLVGALGEDLPGRELASLFEEAGIDISACLVSGQAPTTTKTRILAGGYQTGFQQVIRLDEEILLPATAANQDHFAAALRRNLAEAEGGIVSDYSLGVVSNGLVAAINREMKTEQRLLMVDSREKMLLFSGVTGATPNEIEAEEALKMPIQQDLEALTVAGERLREGMECGHLLITRGNKGMALFEAGQPMQMIPISGSDEVADVTGAGDTVIATHTLSLAAGASPVEAMALSNIAGGLSVMKRGTSTVTQEEILERLAVR